MYPTYARALPKAKAHDTGAFTAASTHSSRQELLKRFAGVTARRQAVRVEAFTTPERFRDYFKARYGPVVAAYRPIADDPGRVTALDDALADWPCHSEVG